ncbi:MAG TPA: SseB family protein [Intrasporangium sp.]|uniref:SseB family protein n=1 Tax=Intrasporangium sp. TaxID=1925024 RepID=UPI002D77BB76|nr:SseB family protein [Intrasporangium sp.]HET7398505.1 SseB family protein [Intrasporangium sp.]
MAPPGAHVDASGRPADSAGQAWAGKRIPSSGFGQDTGAADPRLAAALRATAAAATPESETELLRRVAAARWLVPVVAIPTETDTSGTSVVDTRSDMAAVTLTAPDGSRALPMFSSTDSLAEWDPSARPVPVRAATAAQAAITEQCQALLVDVASAEATVLRPSMVWALAQERTWLPAHLDGHVDAAVAAAVRDEADVTAYRLEAGTPAGAGVLRVVLTLTAGLPRDAVAGVATRIGERLATDGETRARVDALTFALEAAR